MVYDMMLTRKLEWINTKIKVTLYSNLVQY